MYIDYYLLFGVGTDDNLGPEALIEEIRVKGE